MKDIIFYYYLLINIFAFIICSLDKIKAKNNKWRIKEMTLHLFSFLGGVFGTILSMVFFKHKISKLKFKAITFVALILHVTALVYILFYF